MFKRERFFNKLDDYILVLNKENKINFCNKTLLDKLGYTLDEIKNLDIKNIIENYNCNKLNISILKCKNNNKISCSISYLDDDMENKYYIIKDKNIDIENKIVRYKRVRDSINMNSKLSMKLRDEIKNKKSIEDELQQFLDISADFMGMVDLEGNFVKINDKWTELLGWSREELISKTWRGIVYEEDYNYTEQVLRDLVIRNDGKIFTDINRYKCKDGTVKWLQWNLKYLDDRKVIIGTAKDITKNIEIEEQKKQYAKVVQLEKIKNDFFTNMSHEFKTPINVILSAMQLINKHIDEKNILFNENVNLTSYMKSIKKNSYRLLRMTNNLIDMTKIDTGFYTIQLENHNIINIIEDITMSVVNYINNNEIELIFDTEVEEAIVACDPEKVERIMLNLLSNAVKYTSKGGKIEVNLQADSHWITVTVKDNGIGMPKEVQNKIFDSFMQIDTSLTRPCEGSGIGLALVKSLVEMHNGDITVDSECEKGAKFIFRLPVRKAKEINPITNIEDLNRVRVEKCQIEFSDIYYI